MYALRLQGFRPVRGRVTDQGSDLPVFRTMVQEGSDDCPALVPGRSGDEQYTLRHNGHLVVSLYIYVTFRTVVGPWSPVKLFFVS